MTDTPNPLMSALKARIPGETFRLPSQGIFYTNGELASDVVDGEVHVYPMTTHDEILMKTPDKLFSGQAINEVFSKCIPQILKPMELLSKDVDYLLMCLRMLTFGEEVELLYTHNCSGAIEHTYKVGQRPIIASARMVDPTTLSAICEHTTPSGQLVKLRPSKFKHLLSIYQAISLNKTNGEDEDLLEIHKKLTDVLVGMIVSVDGITNEVQIREWLENVPAGWVNTLSTKTSGLGDWGIDSIVRCTCMDCKQPMELEVPVNPISFFT